MCGIKSVLSSDWFELVGKVIYILCLSADV